MSAIAAHITIAGKCNDKEFQLARILGEGLAKENSNVELTVLPMFETDWEEYVKAKSKDLLVNHKVSPLVFYNGKNYIGFSHDFITWAGRVYGFSYVPNSMYCNSLAKKQYKEMMARTRHTFCFFEVAIGEEHAGKVVFELFDDICPIAAKNFKQLCLSKGPRSYWNSPFHRVVRDGWIQGGDVESGSGKFSSCAKEVADVDVGDKQYFHDESFAIRHDKAGVLSMANTGQPHTNGSQFFVTFKPLPKFDKRYVAFGRVVSGMRVFKSIEKLELKNERPVPACVITAAGSVEYNTTAKGEDVAEEEHKQQETCQIPSGAAVENTEENERKEDEHDEDDDSEEKAQGEGKQEEPVEAEY